MIDTETNLKAEVRTFTGYTSELQLSDDGLQTAFDRAKSHVAAERSISRDDDFEWFNTQFRQRQEALFWFTCLFAKVETGELDSQDLQIGAVDQSSLLAKDDDSVTLWYNRATSALNSLQPEKIYQIRSNARSGRQYEAGGFETGSGSGSGGSNEVDASDL
jgi:hypothetical protein